MSSDVLWKTRVRVRPNRGSSLIFLTEQLRDIRVKPGEYVYAGITKGRKRVVIERAEK